MVIIAIYNIPPKMNLKKLVKTLGPIIRGYFEALNFTYSKGTKTAYIRLAEKLSAKDVIHRINCQKIGSHQVKAFIPDNLPNLPLAAKPKAMTAKQRRKLKIPPNDSPKELLQIALDYIMREVQTKFPQLYDLSYTTNHELLETIGKTVYQRVKEIMDDPNCEKGTCFQVTRTYRKKHPHPTDFKLILQTLHSIQDALGKPRSPLQENQLTAIPQAACFLMPYEQLIVTVDSYIDRISNKLVGHVNGLEVTEQTSTAQEAAQMKVRKHLKALGQHLPGMVRQVIMNHVVPADERYCVVKIYGEPFLPNKESMLPFTQQFKPTSVIRSEKMYNLISLKVHRNEYAKLLAADGHWIHGHARLTIRPGKLPFYKVSRFLLEARLSVDDRPEEGATDDRQDDDMEWSTTW